MSTIDLDDDLIFFTIGKEISYERFDFIIIKVFFSIPIRFVK